MKRSAIFRDELAVHEAGHLIVIGLTPEFEIGEFIWRRLPHYEIAHVEPIPSSRFDWEVPADRNALIVRRVVVALAGGAAAEVWRPRREREPSVGVEAIHDTVGRIDFELAHEWLTLQRYDPDQQSLELEIKRLFRGVCGILDTPLHRAALGVVSEGILEHLRAADAAGIDVLKLPGRALLAGLALDPSADFSLEATLLNHPDTRNAGPVTSQ